MNVHQCLPRLQIFSRCCDRFMCFDTQQAERQNTDRYGKAPFKSAILLAGAKMAQAFSDLDQGQGVVFLNGGLRGKTDSSPF